MTTEVDNGRQLAPWRLTRDEADLVLAGLRILRNFHRYSFFDVDEDGREAQATVGALLERLQAELRGAGSK
ncbi:MAG: hypothetical protein K2Y37_11200 [Pirellulales bacterium]|nr:hypothetical protein [Pirellulales bacterium]